MWTKPKLCPHRPRMVRVRIDNVSRFCGSFSSHSREGIISFDAGRGAMETFRSAFVLLNLIGSQICFMKVPSSFEMFETAEDFKWVCGTADFMAILHCFRSGYSFRNHIKRERGTEEEKTQIVACSFVSSADHHMGFLFMCITRMSWKLRRHFTFLKEKLE